MEPTPGFLICLALFCTFVVVLLAKSTKHKKTAEALNSPYRDKALYHSLLISNSQKKGLIFALIVIGILYLKQEKKVPQNEKWRPPEPIHRDTVSPAQQRPSRSSTFHGDKPAEHNF